MPAFFAIFIDTFFSQRRARPRKVHPVGSNLLGYTLSKVKVNLKVKLNLTTNLPTTHRLQAAQQRNPNLTVALPLYSRCIPVALPLHYLCIPVAFPLHYRCITFVFPLHYRCITVASPLYSRCITFALPLHYRCITVALPLSCRNRCTARQNKPFTWPISA